MQALGGKCHPRNFLTLNRLTMRLQDTQNDVRTEATRLSDQVLPVMLRFLADTYDDTSSTVFPFLSTVLLAVSL